jgi:hypothetical protein
MSSDPNTALRLTLAQRRALDWLPRDGSWSGAPGRMSAAVSSLRLRHPALVDIEYREHPSGWKHMVARATGTGRQEQTS